MDLEPTAGKGISAVMTPLRMVAILATLATLATPLLAQSGDAGLSCPPIFNDHAIFQQQIEIQVWGHAQPGAQVTVTLGKQSQEVKTGDDGTWKLKLPAMSATPLESLDSAPAGLTMTVTDGTETLTFHDILIGEVWLCTGQSNMGGKVRNNRKNQNPDDDLMMMQHPAVRQYHLDKGWISATPEEVGEFSRVGVTFGRRLHQELKVPVGLLNGSLGGTSIETWMLPGEGSDEGKHTLGSNYRKYIAPMVGYAVRGCHWYQGEGNVSDGFSYFGKLKSLIDGWRGVWGLGDFPFQIVQLAGIGTSDPEQPAIGNGRAHIREAQFQASQKISHVGIVTAIDIGDPKEHPPNKTDIGMRLARLALHQTYDKTAITPCGPVLNDYEIQCGSIVIRFEHAKGLMIAEKPSTYARPVPKPEAELPWISIQGADGTWHWAVATIEDTDLRVTSPAVKRPVAVRYAYTDNPTGPYLYNAAGLPAFPFTTEAWQDTATKPEVEVCPIQPD